ncbi:growth hormone-inducible transmembrane protein [Sarcoptes scabiei]|nr:growth hormone-inducible transmembrane protein [Sarcoptes scabiei]
MKYRRDFRSIQQWSKQNIPIKSTQSDQAAKLFDSALTQYVGWYDDQIGLGETLSKLQQEDPDFILGSVLSIGLDLIGTGVTVRRDEKIRKQLEDLKQRASQRYAAKEIELFEYSHVEAIEKFAMGQMVEAGSIWNSIIEAHPTDILALKFQHDNCFYLGDKFNLLNSIESVYQIWEQSTDPLQGYIHGMYAFGLEEQKQYEKAEQQAKLGLSKIPEDAWAAHALAHVHEMQHRTADGLSAISQTETDWNQCNYLATHNYWHWCLFQIESDRPEQAIKLFETEIKPRTLKSQNILDIVDATSLLYRLDLIFPKRYSFSEDWVDLYRICEPHFEDHILGFNDCHYSMACLGSDRTEKAEEILENLRSMRRSTDHIDERWAAVTEQVLESMIDFKRGSYRKCMERLFQCREEIVKMGGSDAQRDVFNQLLLVSTLKANDSDRCQTLLKERQTIRSDDVVVREILKTLKNC